MQAHATLAVELVGGRSRCTELRSDPPLTLRETATGVHLVASGAGPVGGDDLTLTVRVGRGAKLDLRSVAAAMVHPGPSGRPSALAVDVELADHATLTWTPQPSILVRGCDHHAVTHLRLGAGATLVWREEVVLGRHDEVPGSVLQRFRVDVEGAPLLRNDLALGPRWPGSLGAAGTGPGARAVGMLLAVNADRGARWAALPAADVDADGVRWAATQLGDAERETPDAHLVTAVAETAGALRAAFDGLAGADGSLFARGPEPAGEPGVRAARRA